MKKKILGFMLIFSIISSIVTMLPMTANAVTNGTCGENLTWTLDDEGVLTISGTGEIEEYMSWYKYRKNIKKIIISDGITTIGESAFYHYQNVVNITLPDSVTYIGSRAFANSSNLTNINIPEKVTFIGDRVFYDCSNLTNITLPQNISNISEALFMGCKNLTNIIIPNGVTSIEKFAFWGCSKFTSINIPNSITTIGNEAFWGCGNLESVFADNLTSWCNISFNNTTSNPLYYAENFYINDELTTSITIPQNITSINSYTFCNYSSLTNITFPDSINTIDSMAFYSCENLTNIILPNNIHTIGNSAFSGCSNLKNMIFPNNIHTIGDSAFYNCSELTDIFIPKNVNSIGYYAFGNCKKLTNILVDVNNLYYSSIDGSLFNKDASTLITYAIGKTDTHYTIPNTVTSIEVQAFAYAPNLKKVTIPDSVIYIGNSAFRFCKALEDIVIPSSVTSIEDTTFYFCDNLKKITIPKSITSIGESALSCCGSLKSIYYTGTVEDFKKITLGISNLSLTADKIIYNYNPNSINVSIENVTSTDNSLKFISHIAIGENVDTEISAFGTVFVPLWLFNSDNAETAAVEYDNSKYNISNGQTYGATITNIPENCKDMHIVGKSYIRDSNGNYVWSPAKYASVNDTTLKSAE